MGDAELDDAMHVVPRLAVAAAAAAAVAAASSTSSSSSGSQLVGSGSGMRSHFAHTLVQISVHRIGEYLGNDSLTDLATGWVICKRCRGPEGGGQVPACDHAMVPSLCAQQLYICNVLHIDVYHFTHSYSCPEFVTCLYVAPACRRVQVEGC